MWVPERRSGTDFFSLHSVTTRIACAINKRIHRTLKCTRKMVGFSKGYSRQSSAENGHELEFRKDQDSSRLSL